MPPGSNTGANSGANEAAKGSNFRLRLHTPGMAARKTHLCCVRGRHRRTIGKFLNRRGKLAPRTFLLGTDRAAAGVSGPGDGHAGVGVVILAPRG